MDLLAPHRGAVIPAVCGCGVTLARFRVHETGLGVEPTGLSAARKEVVHRVGGEDPFEYTVRLGWRAACWCGAKPEHTADTLVRLFVEAASVPTRMRVGE